MRTDRDRHPQAHGAARAQNEPCVVRSLPGWAPGFEGLPLRAAAGVCGVVVHRIEVSQEDPAYGDAPTEVARFFREHPIGVRATGGQMPYAVLIEPDGTVTQALPLTRVAPHAVRQSPTTVGVGVIGDFRHRPPSEAQRAALRQVLVGLARQLGCAADAIAGHDELPGASRDPDKICPGSHLSLQVLRAEVAQALAAGEGGPTFYCEDATGTTG